MDPLSAHALYYLSPFELEIAWISIHTSAVLLCSFPLPIFATTICSRFNNSILPPVPVCQKRTVQSRLLYLDRHNRKGAKWNMPAFFLEYDVDLAEIRVIGSNNRMLGFEVNLLWRKALWTNQTTTWQQNEAPSEARRAASCVKANPATAALWPWQGVHKEQNTHQIENMSFIELYTSKYSHRIYHHFNRKTPAFPSWFWSGYRATVAVWA